MRTIGRAGLAGALATGLVLTAPPAAEADVVATNDAGAAAASITEVPTTVESAAFTGPMGSRAIADAPLAGFPTHGSSFLVLSSGMGAAADDPAPTGNGTDFAVQAPHPDPGPGTGTTVRDLTRLDVSFTAPEGTTCVQFDTKFLSNEIGAPASYNDGFRVFLPTAAGTDPLGNVAFDPLGRKIEAATGTADPGNYTVAHAAGTQYQAASPTMTHTAPIGPGQHTISFVLYDAQDGFVDSTVFIDHLTFGPNCFAALDTELVGPASLVPGRPSAYSLEVTNPTAEPLPFDEAVLALPEGVEYVAGSTTGAAEPTLADDAAVWAPGGTIPAGGTATMGFSVSATEPATSKTFQVISRAGPNEGTASLPVVVGKGASTISAKVRTIKRTVSVKGVVAPDHVGAPVKVQLLRKKAGKFRVVDKDTENLGLESQYAVTFPRPAPGSCKVVARFAGSDTYRSSKVTRKFRC